jgi:hypothetical protein
MSVTEGIPTDLVVQAHIILLLQSWSTLAVVVLAFQFVSILAIESFLYVRVFSSTVFLCTTCTAPRTLS